GGQRVAALGQLVGEAGVDLEQRAVGGGRGGGVHGVVGRGDLVLLPVGAGGAQLHQDAAAALQAVGVARDALVVAAGVEADVGVAVGVLDGLGGGHHGLPGQLQGAVADVGVGGPQHRGGDLLALVVDVAALHVVVDDQVGGGPVVQPADGRRLGDGVVLRGDLGVVVAVGVVALAGLAVLGVGVGVVVVAPVALVAVGVGADHDVDGDGAQDRAVLRGALGAQLLQELQRGRGAQRLVAVLLGDVHQPQRPPADRGPEDRAAFVAGADRLHVGPAAALDLDGLEVAGELLGVGAGVGGAAGRGVGGGGQGGGGEDGQRRHGGEQTPLSLHGAALCTRPSRVHKGRRSGDPAAARRDAPNLVL